MNQLCNVIQVVKATITWNQCANIPAKFNSGQTTTVNGKVYYGGGVTEVSRQDQTYIIYCYDPSQDTWTTLPPLPVKWIGLGQLNGKVVAVGGKRKSDGRRSNEIYSYDERTKKWKQTIPPMPTARHAPGVATIQSMLVVAGGSILTGTYTNVVEIFKSDTSQWYTTDPLPIACDDIPLVAIGNLCYALGGYETSSQLNQALCASADDLLRNAVLADQTAAQSSGCDCNTKSPAWQPLPNTPNYEPTSAILANNLLAVGGREMPNAGAIKQEVYMYSPSTNSWIYFSDLPAPRHRAAVAILSSTEILVIGGWCYGRVNTVHKGSLQCTLPL